MSLLPSAFNRKSAQLRSAVGPKREYPAINIFPFAKTVAERPKLSPISPTHCVPVGREITDLMPEYPQRDIEFGSIIVAIATDAPLLPHQLKRLARRVPMGMARLGAYGSHSSGDIFLAFSTANPGAGAQAGTQQLKMLPNDDMNALFDATVQATEEAIVNAMVAARTMTGINGNTKHAIPHQRLMQLIRGYQRC